MPTTIRHDTTLQIIEIVHTGVVSAVDLQRSTNEGIALNIEFSVNNVLIDVEHMEAVENFMDVYGLPDQYAEGGLSRNVRLAVVKPIKSDALKVAQFFEDVCINRGWMVRQVATRGAAIEWLTSIEPSQKPIV